MIRYDPTDAGFTAWYAATSPAITAVVRATADRAIAEEAVAEAFAQAYARWPKVSAMDSPDGWVCRVAINNCRGRFRRRLTERRALERMPDQPSVEIEAPDDSLWNAVAQLSERSRVAVLLRYVADLPEAEIAFAMGVSRGTVATTLARARSRLNAELTEGQS